MTKRMLLVAAVAAMTLALPLAAVAGIVGSAHDLPLRYTYTGTDAKSGACSFCHVPHKAQSGGEKLFPVTATTDANNAWGSNDSLSKICWFCHGADSDYGSAVQVNPFGASAHKRTVATLTGWGDVGSFPADVKTAGDDNMRCVSCHNIHDNTRRPFLAWGTARGDFSAATAGFCAKCHAGRSSDGGAANIGANNPGQHPSNTSWTDNSTNSPLVGTALPAIMQANMAMLTDYSARSGRSWNLGGHAYYSGDAEQNTIFNCGSCHAVHMNESTVWGSDTDNMDTRTSALATAGDPILVASNAAATATGNNEAICIACHSVAAVRGPGAASTASHPFNRESALATTIGGSRGYIWGSATDRIIQCQSCHDIHWSADGHTGNTQAAALDGDYLLAYGCSDCHSVAGSSITNHHPSNVTITEGTTVVNNAATSTETNWNTLGQTKTATEYFGATTLMTCETCHGLGSANAHNNTGTVFPALTGRNVESDMCVDCHSFNPSTYTQHGTAGLATHFVGSIRTATYKKTNTFMASGGSNNVAIYSTDAPGTGNIICESCHTLKLNGKNGHEITYASANNTSDGEASTKDAVTLMLENSGNMRTVSATTDSLCTECHGSSPGAGVTHPVSPGMTANATTKISFAADAEVTLTSGTTGTIVCESCHRAHDAATDSNAWILEYAVAGTGYTDYSSLCNACHTTAR